MTDELHLEQLKALAQAATPGPWASQEPSEEYRTSYWSVRCPSQPPAVSHELCQLMSINAGEDTDAAYIAAANPVAVLALIAEIERLRTTQPAPIPVQAGEVIDAARKLVKAKGRFHTEQNYKALADALAKHDAAIKAGGQGGEDAVHKAART